ncbi:MAG: hypothetical protein AB2L14_35045 [Candidatus Xenobiia bacterium LiM19]
MKETDNTVKPALSKKNALKIIGAFTILLGILWGYASMNSFLIFFEISHKIRFDLFPLLFYSIISVGFAIFGFFLMTSSKHAPKFILVASLILMLFSILYIFIGDNRLTYLFGAAAGLSSLLFWRYVFSVPDIRSQLR